MRFLSAFSLKVLALIFMILDHLYQFFPEIMPVWFTYIGRMSAPIFLFLVVESWHYTSNKLQYLRRLGLGYIGLWLLDIVLGIDNNIFGLFFVLCLGFLFYEWSKRTQRMIFFIGGVFLFFGASFAVTFFALKVPSLMVYWSILPNLFLIEGGPLFLLLGWLFYLNRGYFLRIALSIAGVALLTIVGGFEVYQLYMIGSVLWIGLYNGRKGYGLRWLFYIVYPTHLFVFWLIQQWRF